jgi:3D (Asp-Asp-Asp) domain-containing protein
MAVTVKPSALPGVLIVAVAVFSAFLGVYLWFHRPAPVTIVLYNGDKAQELLTRAKTVGQALTEQKITLKPRDVVVPALDSPVTSGMEIDLGILDRQVKEAEKNQVFETQTDYTNDLNVGEIIEFQQGKDGRVRLQIEDYLLNGEEAFEKVLKTTVLKPVKNAKVLEGTAQKTKMYPMGRKMRVAKTLTLEATAYYPGPENNWPYSTGSTASGLKAGYGIAAVDPKRIKLKTPLYIEGYGFALAGDTGSAIKGDRIDLCYDTYDEAQQFGRKKVKVYLLR